VTGNGSFGLRVQDASTVDLGSGNQIDFGP
jgi:hypothetical protein